jgi:hypothetical protein
MWWMSTTSFINKYSSTFIINIPPHLNIMRVECGEDEVE